MLLASVLAWFYDLVPDYGFAIVMLTIAVMILTTPLILKSTRSMIVMQQLQPEIKKIQSRYKDDRQKLNEELLKFYKEHEISPLGGCLPLLIQMPVFIVLYQVLHGITRRLPDAGFSTGWILGQRATGAIPTKPPGDYALSLTFDPAYVPHDSSLYQSLSQHTTMEALGMDLASSASQSLSKGLVTALPYLLLIVVVGVTGYIQQKQIQGRNPNAEPNPQQQVLMRVMPIILPVISFSLPAGLVLYFAVSNCFRVGQQQFISRNLYGIRRGREPGDAAESGAAGTRSDTTEGRKGTGRGKGSGVKGRDRTRPGPSGRTPAAKAARAPTKARMAKSANGRNPDGKAATTGKAKSGAANRKPTGQRAQTLQPRARKQKKR